MSRRWDTTVIPQAGWLMAVAGEAWSGSSGHGQDSACRGAAGHGTEKVRCLPPTLGQKKVDVLGLKFLGTFDPQNGGSLAL